MMMLAKTMYASRVGGVDDGGGEVARLMTDCYLIVNLVGERVLPALNVPVNVKSSERPTDL